MSQWSFPHADQAPDDEDGRPYTDAETRQFHRAVFMQDDETAVFVLEGAGNEFAVTAPSANTLRVNTGAAFVDGFFIPSDASEDLAANNAPGGQSRRDRVIIRANWAAYTVRLVLKEGTSGTVPSLTQTRNTTWEMSLAYYDIDDAGAITNLTSEVGDDEMCHFATRVKAGMFDADVVDDSTLELSSGAMRIKSTAAGDGLGGGGASPLEVKVDGSTIEIDGDTLKVVGGEASIRIVGEIIANAEATLGGTDSRRMVVSAVAYESWVHCDGGAAVNGVTIPDYRGKVIAGASASNAAGTTAGADSIDIAHTHPATGLSMNTVADHKHDVGTAPTGDIQGGTTYHLVTDNAGTHTHTMAGNVESRLSATQDVRQPTAYENVFIYVGT